MQLLAAYTNPESHNAQRHRQTDRRTDGQQDDDNSRSCCVSVRSANEIATNTGSTENKPTCKAVFIRMHAR